MPTQGGAGESWVPSGIRRAQVTEGGRPPPSIPLAGANCRPAPPPLRGGYVPAPGGGGGFARCDPDAGLFRTNLRGCGFRARGAASAADPPMPPSRDRRDRVPQEPGTCRHPAGLLGEALARGAIEHGLGVEVGQRGPRLGAQLPTMRPRATRAVELVPTRPVLAPVAPTTLSKPLPTVECGLDLRSTLAAQLPTMRPRAPWFNYLDWGVYARTQLGVTDPIPLPWYRRCLVLGR